MTTTTTVRLQATVLYNDAIVDRYDVAEKAIQGVRYSQTAGHRRGCDCRACAVLDLQGTLPFARMLSESAFHDGDPLLDVHCESVEVKHDPNNPTSALVAVASAMFERLNIAHPAGWAHRSMSMGDVVLVGETAMVCESSGWTMTRIAGSEIKQA